MPQARNIGVLEVPINSGQPNMGPKYAPSQLGKMLKPKLESHGFNVIHEKVWESLPGKFVPKRRGSLVNDEITGTATHQAVLKVESILARCDLCLFLCGDHASAISTVYGHGQHAAKRDQDVAVLWVDAHADIHTQWSTPSGNIHGTPLAFVAKELKDEMGEIPGFDWLNDPRLSLPTDLAYLGLRSVEDEEKDIIAKNNIKVKWMEDINEIGIEEATKEALDHLNIGMNRRLHVSFDIDAMDPTIAPSTGTPENGGLSLVQGLHIVQEAALTGHLKCIDLAEVDLKKGSDEDVEITCDTALKILLVASGAMSVEEALK